MNIELWNNFSKRKNSTKTPATTGTVKTVVLKEETSIEKPTFIIAEPLTEWTYVKAFNKYYFVSDVVNLDGYRSEIVCDIDTLATYKSEILSYSAFVERASSSYDPYVNDPALSQSQLVVNDDTTSTSLSGFFGGSYGCFLVECLAKDMGVVLYATPTLEPYKFIFAPSAYTTQDKQQWIQSTISQSFDLDVYIGSVKWFPFDASDLGVALGSGHFPIGPVDLGVASGFNFTIYNVNQSDPNIGTHSVSINLPTTNNYNDFRDCNNQYTQYTMYLPGVGLVQVDASIIGYAIHNSKTLTMEIDVDLISGDITYILSFIDPILGGTRVARYSGNVSVDVPIGKSAVDTVKSAKMFAGSVGTGALRGGVWGAIGGALIGGVEAIYNHMTPDTSMVGGSGNKTELILHHSDILLGRKQFGAKDYPTSVAGRPLMQNVTLSSLSGYVKCGGASVPLNAHEEDMSIVNNYLNSGFYIE